MVQTLRAVTALPVTIPTSANPLAAQTQVTTLQTHTHTHTYTFTHSLMHTHTNIITKNKM